MDDVVPNQFEIGPFQEVCDIGLLAGKEVIDADHVVPLVDQAFAEVRSKEPGATRY
jgi:hypothetical protein